LLMIHNISVMMWLVAPYSSNSDHGVNGQGDEEMCADRAERTNDLARFFAGRIANKPLRLNQLAYRHLRMLSILMKAQEKIAGGRLKETILHLRNVLTRKSISEKWNCQPTLEIMPVRDRLKLECWSEARRFQ
jgi:hypothetical protein